MEITNRLLYVFYSAIFLLVFHIITAVIAIVLLVATFVLSVIVLRNFGRGLMEACMYSQFFSFNQPIFIVTCSGTKSSARF